MLGLFGATMAWVGGHPMLAVLLVYSLIGSLGTLLVAMLSMHRALEQVQPRH
jgi:Flp pilus assembly protein protease CpaA